ncbi:MAG: heme-binding protein [Chlamydiales bacterium]|nr:heme-binding protein [Chlamydiales bacterium]
MGKEPKYEILESYDKIELRLYASFLVAEVECSGIRKEAIRSGFRILANYIFGNNVASAKLPMSVPVTQQKIDDLWKIRFMLTQASDLNDLPQPNNQLVKLFSIPEKKVAAIRFSGIANDEKLQRYTTKLREFADSHKWPLDDRPILAFYNPPWTLPFLRRNEILFEVLDPLRN